MEIKGGLKQQRSEKFYLQRRERKGCMGSCSKKLVVPWVKLEIRFYSFFYCPKVDILVGQMLKKKHLFSANRYFLERRRGIFPPG
jgi:hypothetical protein